MPITATATAASSLILIDVPHFPSAATFRSLVKSVSSLGASSRSRPNSVVSAPPPTRKTSAVVQQQEEAVATTAVMAEEEEEALRKQELQSQSSQVIANVLAHVMTMMRCDNAGDMEVDFPSSFQGSKAPEITLGDYFERLVKYANNFSRDVPGPASSGVRGLLLALELVQRSKLELTPLTVHRIFLVAMLEAIKSNEDCPISAKYWGQVGGVTMMDLNRMERDFCVGLEFRLHVTLEQYQALQREFGVFSDMDV